MSVFETFTIFLFFFSFFSFSRSASLFLTQLFFCTDRRGNTIVLFTINETCFPVTDDDDDDDDNHTSQTMMKKTKKKMKKSDELCSNRRTNDEKQNLFIYRRQIIKPDEEKKGAKIKRNSEKDIPLLIHLSRSTLAFYVSNLMQNSKQSANNYQSNICRCIFIHQQSKSNVTKQEAIRAPILSKIY